MTYRENNCGFCAVKCILMSLLAIASNVYAQADHRYYTCNEAAVKQAQAENRVCDQSSTRYQQSVCLSRVYKNVAQNACSVALISMGRSVGFIYDRMAEVDSPENAKRTPVSKRNEQYEQLNKLASGEKNMGVANFNSELSSIRSEAAVARANAAIDRSIYIMGGVVNRPSNDTFTYIYRGKPTTCTTVGNVINCL